jgi:hypothetical protein
VPNIINQPAVIKTVLNVGQGPSGPPGAGVSNSLVALQPIGGHRVVIASGLNGADYADAFNPLHFGRVVGVTTGAADGGAMLLAQSAGPIDEASWNWIPDEDIWLGPNGTLTQVLPAEAAFVQRVGFAQTPTHMWVDLSEPVSY